MYLIKLLEYIILLYSKKIIPNISLRIFARFEHKTSKKEYSPSLAKGYVPSPPRSVTEL